MRPLSIIKFAGRDISTLSAVNDHDKIRGTFARIRVFTVVSDHLLVEIDYEDQVGGGNMPEAWTWGESHQKSLDNPAFCITCVISFFVCKILVFDLICKLVRM